MKSRRPATQPKAQPAQQNKRPKLPPTPRIDTATFRPVKPPRRVLLG